jgi:hypothetical protein
LAVIHASKITPFAEIFKMGKNQTDPPTCIPRSETALMDPNVISVSRRTDVPAFHARWFYRRLEEGFAEYRNPFSGKTCRVSLEPGDVRVFVFWTRNAAPMMRNFARLEERGTPFYFLYTINAYPKTLEGANPPLGQAVRALLRLSERIGPERVRWRYDPIVLTRETDENYHRRNFGRIAAKLEGATEECIFSFMDLYGKVKRNMGVLPEGFRAVEVDLARRRALAADLAEIAGRRGIRLLACCEDDMVGVGAGEAGNGMNLAEPLAKPPEGPGRAGEGMNLAEPSKGAGRAGNGAETANSPEGTGKAGKGVNTANGCSARGNAPAGGKCGENAGKGVNTANGGAGTANGGAGRANGLEAGTGAVREKKCGEMTEFAGRIGKARCIDSDLINRISGSFRNIRTKPSRAECACAASRDIGGYDTCPHGCVYCYANASPGAAIRRFRQCDPALPML